MRNTGPKEPEGGVKLPEHVLYRKSLSLMLWKPQGILDETLVKKMVTFIETVEKRSGKPFNRFIDFSALDMVDLNFKFVFHVALGRRLSYAKYPAIKSAFYVTSRATAHYAKLHAMLTDYSPLEVKLFGDLASAAKWLGVPVATFRME
jgi:hypothetical protein